jgi:YD repeat-containing protein
MRRTLGSLGAVLLLVAAVSVSAVPASEASGRAYQYDARGRLVAVSATPANAQSGRTFQYDAEGRLSEVSAATASAASPDSAVTVLLPGGIG